MRDDQRPTRSTRSATPATTTRRRGTNFIGGDAHDGPSPLDFFVWLVRGEAGTFVIDTGFDAGGRAGAGAQLITPVGDGLAALGVAPAGIDDVVVTHMHYDHAGNHDLFPAARYHLQDAEMAFCTGRAMTHAALRHAYTRRRRARRWCARCSTAGSRSTPATTNSRLAVSLHLIGGHTAGHAGGAGVDAARLAGAGLGRRPPLRQHGRGPAVPDRARRGGDAGGASDAEAARRATTIWSSPATTRWFWRASRPPEPALAGHIARLDADPIGPGA